NRTELPSEPSQFVGDGLLDLTVPREPPERRLQNTVWEDVWAKLVVVTDDAMPEQRTIGNRGCQQNPASGCPQFLDRGDVVSMNTATEQAAHAVGQHSCQKVGEIRAVLCPSLDLLSLGKPCPGVEKKVVDVPDWDG